MWINMVRNILFFGVVTGLSLGSTCLCAFAVTIEIDDKVYLVRSLHSERQDIWDSAIATLKKNRSNPQSWKNLNEKAALFEKYGYKGPTTSPPSAPEKAQLLALSDMATYIGQTGGKRYLDVLKKCVTTTKHGKEAFFIAEATADFGVPVALMATGKVTKKSLINASISFINTVKDGNAIDYGVAIGHKYMALAQDYTQKVIEGKDRIRSGEVFTVDEFKMLYTAAENARTYGVIGSQIATLASTLGRDGFTDVFKEHLPTLIETTLHTFFTINADAMANAKNTADRAKGFGAGRMYSEIFKNNLLSNGIPKKIVDTLIKNNDMLKELNAINEAWGTSAGIAGLLDSELKNRIDKKADLTISNDVPISDSELLQVYEILFDDRFPSLQISDIKDNQRLDRNTLDISSGSPSSSPKTLNSPDLGDISIDSQIGNVTIVNETPNDLEVNIHSIEATGHVDTGDITIQGKGTDITVTKESRRDKTDVNIGSVKLEN